MADVTVREADVYDIPLLAQELKSRFPGWEQIDFHQARTLIAEYNGKPFMSCSARLVWQIEPLMIFDEDVPQSAKRRGMYELFKQTERWISDPAQNTTGVLCYVCHICFDKVIGWAARMGMKLFPGGCFASKTLPPQ